MVSKESRPSLLPLVLLFAILITGLHVGTALVGRSAFRALHLGPAINYAHGSIDLFHPVVVGFNAGNTPMAQEFPLWQALVGLTFKITHGLWFGWANVVSLVLFGLGVWPFYQFARQYVGERGAWWSVVFFLAQPLIFFESGNGSTNGMCLVFTLWFVYCADRMLRTRAWGWWAATALFAILSIVSKLPFFMAAGLFSFFLLLSAHRTDLRLWLQLASAGALAGAVFFAWTHYTDALASQAEFPYVDVRLSHSPFIAKWYFGDWHSRLSVGAWIRGAWRFLHATLGSLPLAAVLLIALFQSGNVAPKLWLAATAVTTLIFSNLVLEHHHYYLMCSPGVALLCGAMAARWEQPLAREIPAAGLRLTLVAVFLVFNTVDGLTAMKIANEYDAYPREVARVIRDHTRPEDKLIICGENQWGGDVLIRAQRNGLSVFSFDHLPDMPGVKSLGELLNDEADVRRLKQLGFNKVVLLSESPVRFAVTAVNPGSKRTYIHYPSSISPKVDAWPVEYQSEFVLIKEIP